MTTPASKTRWKTAQDYELKWWENRKGTITLDYFTDYANDLLDYLQGFIEINQNTGILEIGSGAAGIITFLPGNHRFAIDPLQPFFSAVGDFSNFRDPRVKYSAAKGENLPFREGVFDLVICDNVLDHCENPTAVIGEMSRVLTKNGIVYLRVHTYHAWGKLVRTGLERWQLDKGHPHTLTVQDLTSILCDSNFEVLRTSKSRYMKTWLQEFAAGTLRNCAKALLFVTGNTTRFLARKRSHFSSSKTSP